MISLNIMSIQKTDSIHFKLLVVIILIPSLAQYPIQTYGYAFLFSLCGYLGIQFVLTLVRGFGATISATVTTARKAVTIILSFIFFSKPFSVQ